MKCQDGRCGNTGIVIAMGFSLLHIVVVVRLRNFVIFIKKGV